MINKIIPSVREAIEDIKDGASLLISGFGGAGTPYNLVDALVKKGVKDLTLITNSLSTCAALVENRRVKKIICSFPTWLQRSKENPILEGVKAGTLEVEITPQGTLAERIRAGGGGIPAFYTPTGVGTEIEVGKEKRIFAGKEYLLERAVKADFALIKAYKADRLGNLVYHYAMRNFNPIVAMCGNITIAEVEEIVDVGSFEPNQVITPGIYVHRVIKTPKKNIWVFKNVPVRVIASEKDRQRELISKRAVRELKSGMYVNLGGGLPTNISNYIPPNLTVYLQSENGILGYGSIADEDRRDPDLINASGQPTTLIPGASFCNQAEAFAMIRGGHIDLSILGAFQVSQEGDLANWKATADPLGGVGGAMDLTCGARRVIVVMEHTTPNGEPRLVKRCTLPLTGKKCVNTIITNLAVIEVTPQGLFLLEVAPGTTPQEVQALTEAQLIISAELKVMQTEIDTVSKPQQIDKVYPSPMEAVKDIHNGASIFISGFGGGGVPFNLVEALGQLTLKGLTFIGNSSSTFGALVEKGQAIKVVATYPGYAQRSRYDPIKNLYREGKLEVEAVPLGTMMERIRSAGAGIAAFYTPTGVGMMAEKGKEKRNFNGRDCLLEHALRADFALIKAYKADRSGNLIYRYSARNHGPIMAAAARITIAEVEEVVETGQIDPELIITPHIYVDRVVQVPRKHTGWYYREKGKGKS